MMSKWWARAESWRQMDAEREGTEFVGREYDETLDEAALVYARWRQGAEAETLPHYEGPFQISYNNALMFMPDVIALAQRVTVASVLRDLTEREP